MKLLSLFRMISLRGHLTKIQWLCWVNLPCFGSLSDVYSPNIYPWLPIQKNGGGGMCALFTQHISNCFPFQTVGRTKRNKFESTKERKAKQSQRFRYIIPLTLPLTERDISDGCLSTLGGYSRQKEEDCHHWPPDFVFLDRVDIHMREYRNIAIIYIWISLTGRLDCVGVISPGPILIRSNNEGRRRTNHSMKSG